MIDWNKSAELNNTTMEELKAWVKKYPSSGKRIIAICNICSGERKIYFNQYRDLCQPCSKRTPKARKAARLKQIEQYSTQRARDAQSERVKRWHKNHTKWGKVHSEWMLEYCKDPKVRKENSDRLKNSDAAKEEQNRQRGGYDIIQHHYIYDDSDRSKYTVEMIRSDHTSLHRLFQKLGYIVPHINVRRE